MKTCPICEKSWPSHHTNCEADGALLIDSRELEPGTVIRGKYRIVRMLGRGGMGTVYLAEHILLGRLRALKFISSELSQDAAFLRRFRREAQAAIELRHPNVVEVVDLDQAEDGSPYIAMEYVEGPDLRHALADGAFPIERALAIARGIALGLGAAHAKGIIHRDVKPENILLAGGEGKPETSKLLDFGIAAMKESVTVASRTHGLMLTPPYAAPEQWKGMVSEDLDGRTDLYALGGVLYEMLTGQTCFHAPNTEGWMYQHLHQQPPPPSQLRPELSEWRGLDALVLRLLAKERERRPRNVAELLGMLDEVKYAAPIMRRKDISESPSLYLTAPVAFLRSFATWKWATAAAVMVAGVGILLAVRALLSAPATAVPVLTPVEGTYAATQTVSITDATPNAVIHYTVDGSPPTEASPVYTQPFTLQATLTALPPVSSGRVRADGTVIRAMATAKDHTPSADITGLYLWSTAARPATNPPGGSSYDQGNKEQAAREPQPPDSTSTVWTDPATWLLWAKKDNGSDVTWQQATEYCRKLQLAGHSDWRLPTIEELQGIYDPHANAGDFHVKGNLQLTGWHWSSSPGNASGKASYFFFTDGELGSDRFNKSYGKRALCVRHSGE
jgi:tRNA A-37 threonylcarbamoyl transferase component Bud32